MTRILSTRSAPTWLLLTAVCAVLATACADDVPTAQSAQDRIALLEARLTANPNPETFAELTGLYRAEAADTAQTATYRLNRHRDLARAYLAANRHTDAYEALREGARDFPRAATVPEAGLAMAQIAQQRLRQPATAALIHATLAERFAAHPVLTQLASSIKPRDRDSLRRAMQGHIYGPGGFDREAAIRYGDAAMAHAALTDDVDEAVRDHLASGRVLEQAKQYDRALRHYREVQRAYPQHRKAADAMFLEAFVLREVYADRDAGDSILTAFLTRHPAHTLADDARALLAE